ncbi:MAG: hypothetical protein RQM92_16025 [Candidatus Syntrophopropionicum ammoniitolerans]
MWQSSNLDRPNYDGILIDLNGNGKNELVVTEGDYADPRVRQTSVWQWNGWGFSKIPYGVLRNMRNSRRFMNPVFQVLHGLLIAGDNKKCDVVYHKT